MLFACTFYGLQKSPTSRIWMNAPFFPVDWVAFGLSINNKELNDTVSWNINFKNRYNAKKTLINAEIIPG